eukprot:Sdes_comp18639_c0_seq1m8837
MQVKDWKNLEDDVQEIRGFHEGWEKLTRKSFPLFNELVNIRLSESFCEERNVTPEYWSDFCIHVDEIKSLQVSFYENYLRILAQLDAILAEYVILLKAFTKLSLKWRQCLDQHTNESIPTHPETPPFSSFSSFFTIVQHIQASLMLYRRDLISRFVMRQDIGRMDISRACFLTNLCAWRESPCLEANSSRQISTLFSLVSKGHTRQLL